MENSIGRLGDEVFALLRQRGDAGFDRLFAELADHDSEPSMRQVGDVARARVGLAALVDNVLQSGQGIHGHLLARSATRGQASGTKRTMRLADRVLAKMKDRGGEDRAGMALRHAFDKMV